MLGHILAFSYSELLVRLEVSELAGGDLTRTLRATFEGYSENLARIIECLLSLFYSIVDLLTLLVHGATYCQIVDQHSLVELKDH